MVVNLKTLKEIRDIIRFCAVSPMSDSKVKDLFNMLSVIYRTQ